MTHIAQATKQANLYANKNDTMDTLRNTQEDGNISQTQATREKYLDKCWHAHMVEHWPLTYNIIIIIKKGHSL